MVANSLFQVIVAVGMLVCSMNAGAMELAYSFFSRVLFK